MNDVLVVMVFLGTAWLTGVAAAGCFLRRKPVAGFMCFVVEAVMLVAFSSIIAPPF